MSSLAYSNPYQSTSPAEANSSGGSGYFFKSKVTALERAGRKDPIVKFDVHTNLPRFRTTQFRDIRRTHGEFIKLAEHLSSSVAECYVPALPPSSTSAGAGTDEDDTRVKAMIQKWMDRVFSDPILVRDEEIIFFIESDFGYSPVYNKKQPATGLRRKAIKMQAPPQDDTTELAEARPLVKKFYLGAVEASTNMNKQTKARKEGEFGIKLGLMAAVEGHRGMQHAFKKLAKTMQAVGDLHSTQATSEAASLGDHLSYHAADAFIVKETLTNRQILMRDLLTAQSNTRSKRSTADRLRGSSNLKEDKVNEALAAHEEAKSQEQYMSGKVSRVTTNLQQQQKNWINNTISDLRLAIRDYTLRQIEAERRALGVLESVRPDVRAIDGTGGLSRLGRDSVPPRRSMAGVVSQGPKGDAWSGPVRRSSFVSAQENTSTPETVTQRIMEDDEIDARSAASKLASATF